MIPSLKAIAVAPDEPLNYLFLARLYDQDFHNRSAALRIARQGVDIGNIPSERLESIEAEQELKQWLQKIALSPASDKLDF